MRSMCLGLVVGMGWTGLIKEYVPNMTGMWMRKNVR